MKSLRQLIAPALAALLFATGATQAARAEGDPLAYVPGNAGAVVSVNIRSLFDSDAFQRVFEEKADKQARSGLNMLKALFGVDILKDLDRAILFAEDPERGDDTGAVIVQGRFDANRLVQLVQANVDYEEQSIGGMALHTWRDNKDDATKYACFPSEGLVIVSGSRAVLENALAASKNKKAAFAASEAGAMLPRDAERAIAWAAVTKGKNRDLHELGVDGAAAALYLDNKNVSVWASLSLTKDASVEDFRDVLEGVAALARIQRESEELAGLGHRAEVTANGRQVEMSVSMPVDDLIDAID